MLTSLELEAEEYLNVPSLRVFKGLDVDLPLPFPRMAYVYFVCDRESASVCVRERERAMI